MVSAQPVFFDFLRGQGRTSKNVGLGFHIEDFYPRAEILDEYCEGINATPEQRQIFQQTRLQAAVHEATGLRAVTGATDMQFMLRREAARQLIPLPIAGALTAKDAIEIPRGIENLDYWILSSDEPLVRHMGNTVIGRGITELEVVMQQTGISGIDPVQGRYRTPDTRHRTPDTRGLKNLVRSKLQHWLDRSPRLRRLLTRMYDNLFSLLYEER
jgi:hypothetical protein